MLCDHSIMPSVLICKPCAVNINEVVKAAITLIENQEANTKYEVDLQSAVQKLIEK